MRVSQKVKKRVLIALLVSLFIHIGFLVWSYFCRLLPPVPFPEKPETVFHVKIDKEEHVGQQHPKYDTEFSKKSPNPDNPFTETASVPSVQSEELIKNKIQSSVQKQQMALIPSAVQNEVLKKSELNDVIVTRKVRRSVRENLVDMGEVPTEDFASGTPVINSGETISKHFLDKSAIPANNALAAPLKTVNTQNEFQVMKKASSGMEHQARAQDLGTALTFQLYKYQDGQGQKYFKLAVMVRDATINFPIIPKEMIFLLDASGSIGAKRLGQEEDGIIYSLKHLNPDDRFNILVFNNKSNYFKPDPIGVSKDNVRDAVDFLRGIKSWSTTDIYGALKASIAQPDQFVPSYRVVMTDGIPTTGIQDDMHVINEISDLNDNKISFFTFGGGAQVDPYMLDFIAFKNRGWSVTVDRDYFMGRELSRLYDEIKDPLLLNVRYYVGGLDPQEIFPQTMPDFFKGSQFVVYGRYSDEDKFVLQVRGEMSKEKKQFIVSASLKDALLGTKQIAHDWAFHKIYYLIGLLKYNENNQELLNEIHELGQKYHIITPYSIIFHEGLNQPRPSVWVKSKSQPKAAVPDSLSSREFVNK